MGSDEWRSDQDARVLAGVLTRRQRKTCAAAWGEKLTHEQIATAQGISKAASEKRTQRARRRLHEAGIEAPDGRRRTARRARAWQLDVNENV